MDVRLKGQAVIKRNMKRYSVLLLGMHENSLDSNEVEEAEQRLDDALCSLCGNQPVYRGSAAVLAPSSGEKSASPRHRAGVASMALLRRFTTNAPCCHTGGSNVLSRRRGGARRTAAKRRSRGRCSSGTSGGASSRKRW